MSSIRRGYTLFELVLVLAVIVLFAAIAYPSLETMFSDYRMTAATDTVRGQWAAARSRAIEEGRPYRFSVVPNKGNFRVAPDSGDYWSGDSPAAADSSNPPLDLKDSLPKGIRFSMNDAAGAGGLDVEGDSSLPGDSVDAGMWTTLVVFLPDGTTRGPAREDIEITLYGRGFQSTVVSMRALTGVVSVRPAGVER